MSYLLNSLKLQQIDPQPNSLTFTFNLTPQPNLDDRDSTAILSHNLFWNS